EAKFYLDATPEVRAQRRAAQLRELGRPVDLDTLRDAIVLRDRKDSTRRTGPLIRPEDAEAIDTSAMTLDAVVDLLEGKVRSKAPWLTVAADGDRP
ncbi:MAG: (d)CMP kinase, partial [Planctomycetota bacterium]